MLQVVKWYREVLNFLPVQLLHNPSLTTSQVSAATYVSGAWKVSVENFLMHHPAPTLTQLQKVKNVIPVIDNINVRNQARLLVNRYIKKKTNTIKSMVSMFWNCKQAQITKKSKCNCIRLVIRNTSFI